MLGAVLGLGLLCAGCGDVYRPVANPIPGTGGDTQRMRHAIVLARSADPSTAGTAANIDISGDTNVNTFTVGRNPVNAASLAGQLHAFIADQADDTVKSYLLVPPPGSVNPPNSATLPGSAAPSFVAVAGIKVFVTEPGINSVADIDSSSNSVTAQVPVGTNPVALAATPDGTKVYCMNKGSNSVSVIIPASDTASTSVASFTGISPVWGAVSSDGKTLYVVNQGSGDVSVIDTTADAQVKTLPAGAAPNYATFQSTQARLYVTSPSGNTLTIINTPGGDPTLATATTVSVVCNAPSGTLSATPPIVTAVTCDSGLANPAVAATSAVWVTALADGTRAYVADQGGNQVFVLNTATNKFTKLILVGTSPVGITSDTDSTRVLTANAGTTVPISSVSFATSNAPNVFNVTVTTTASNQFLAGQGVTIAGVSAAYDGLFTITNILSPTQFTYQTLQSPGVNLGAGGAATVSNVSIIQTSNDDVVKQNDGVTPLTVPLQGQATFIVGGP